MRPYIPNTKPLTLCIKRACSSSFFPITRVPSAESPPQYAFNFSNIFSNASYSAFQSHKNSQSKPLTASEIVSEIRNVELIERVLPSQKRSISAYLQKLVLDIIDKPITEDEVYSVLKHLSVIKVSSFDNMRIKSLTDKMVESPEFKKTLRQVSANIIANKYEPKDISKIIYLLSYLQEPEARQKAVDLIKPYYAVMSNELSNYFIKSIEQSPIIKNFDVVKFLKNNSLIQEIMHTSTINAQAFFLMTKIIGKYDAPDNVVVYMFLINVSKYHRTLSAKMETPKMISGYATRLSYCMEMLYKYEMIRDSYLNITKRNHYNIARLTNKLKMMKFDLNQLESLIESHLRISSFAHIGDGFLNKIYACMVHNPGCSVPMLMQLLKNIMANIHTRSFITVSDDPQRVSTEHAHPHTSVTYRVLALLFFRLPPAKAAPYFFKINAKSRPQRLDKDVEESLYRSDASLTDLAITTPPDRLSKLLDSFFSAIEWDKISMEELKDIAKFFENNRQIASVNQGNMSNVWEFFEKNSKGSQDQLIIETLYWMSFHFKESAREYFKKNVLPKFLEEDNSQKISNPLRSMTSSFRNVDYLVPLLANLNDPQILKNEKVQNIINTQVSRVIPVWDDEVLVANLQAFEKVSAHIPVSQKIMIKLMSQLSVTIIYIRNMDQFYPNTNIINSQFAKYMIWFLNYNWTRKPVQTGAFQVIFVELWKNQLQKAGGPKLILRLMKIIGRDSNKYLGQTLALLTKIDYQEFPQVAKQMQRYVPLNIPFKGVKQQTTVQVPDINASAEEYEEYLMKVFRSRTLKPAHLDRVPKSRQEKILALGIKLAIDVQQSRKFNQIAKSDWTLDLRKYKDELEDIFDIKIVSLNDGVTTKVEIPEQKSNMIKVEYSNFQKINRAGYGQILLSQFDPAQQCIRTVIFNARYFRWLSKPPTLHSFSKSSVYLQKFVLPILVNKNAKFRVYNPMIRKTDSTEAIMVANNSTWRERCVWAYTLEKDKGGPIYMIDMDGDQGEAKQTISKVFD